MKTRMKLLLVAGAFAMAITTYAQAQAPYIVCKLNMSGTEIIIQGNRCPSGTYFVRYVY